MSTRFGSRSSSVTTGSFIKELRVLPPAIYGARSLSNHQRRRFGVALGEPLQIADAGLEVALWVEEGFGRWLFNSVIVAGATMVVGVFLACTAAYAFSRFRFPGRRMGLMSFLVSQMFPGVLTLIPIYIILVKWLGLGSSYIGLVLAYSTVAIPFCVWMLKGYFDTIPRELEESALIDGASPAMIFFRIVLPLAKPAVAVTALFSFMTGWNEFIVAATIIDREDMYTAPVGLQFFVGGFSQEWGNFSAGAIIAAIPVVLLFFFLQRYLISGLTAGAVKG